MPVILAQSWQAQHPDYFGSTGAIDNLFTTHPPAGTKPYTIDLPTVTRFRDRLRKLVESNLHTGLGTLFFSKDRVKKLIRINLVLPMSLGHFGKVRKLSIIELDALFDQFPADPRDNLFPPSIKQAGKRHSTRRGRTTELAVAFYDQRLCSGATGLNSCHMPRCSTTDYENIHLVHNFGLGCVLNRLSRGVRGRSDRQTCRCGSQYRLLQKITTPVVVLRVRHQGASFGYSSLFSAGILDA